MFIKIPYCDNNVEFDDDFNFSAIIGGDPSKGARSPILWNKVYKNINSNVKMLALDVSQNNLDNLLIYLETNKNFIGGAISVPHKKSVFNFLNGNVSDECKIIGSVNCISKDKKNKLFGNNTDGYGSLLSIKNNFKKVNKNSKCMIIGDGGAGVAVAVYLKNLVDSKNIYIFSRSKLGKNLSKKINSKWYHFNKIGKYANTFELIINATSLGYGDLKDLTPINENIIKKIKSDAMIFDIIYDPFETKLLIVCKKYNLKSINGLEMNLLQAVLAFSIVNNYEDLDKIQFIMSK